MGQAPRRCPSSTPTPPPPPAAASWRPGSSGMRGTCGGAAAGQLLLQRERHLGQRPQNLPGRGCMGGACSISTLAMVVMVVVLLQRQQRCRGGPRRAATLAPAAWRRPRWRPTSWRAGHAAPPPPARPPCRRAATTMWAPRCSARWRVRPRCPAQTHPAPYPRLSWRQPVVRAAPRQRPTPLYAPYSSGLQMIRATSMFPST